MSKEAKNSNTQALTTKSNKDFWDKLDIATKPVAAFLTAIIIAIIGYFSQKTITGISLQEQNARLYTELLARREDAESALRKDMFKEIMSGFFTQMDPKNIENDLSKKVLKLELLAINFGDSLSLGPLFSEMSSDIERILEANKKEIPDWKNVASVYQKRLRSLAKRVASTQYSTIYPSGVPFTLNIPIDEVLTDEESLSSSDWTYIWPYDDPNVSDQGNVFLLDNVKRSFEISFRNANFAQQSVQVKLDIFEFSNEKVKNEKGQFDTVEQMSKVSDLEFTLDYFNFPLIDNTRLSNNQRFTLIIEDFDTNTIKVAGMIFPGLYASQRDKPFLNEAIQELGDQQKSIDTQMERSQ